MDAATAGGDPTPPQPPATAPPPAEPAIDDVQKPMTYLMSQLNNMFDTDKFDTLPGQAVEVGLIASWICAWWCGGRGRGTGKGVS
jgi:hypothetical protein